MSSIIKTLTSETVKNGIFKSIIVLEDDNRYSVITMINDLVVGHDSTSAYSNEQLSTMVAKLWINEETLMDLYAINHWKQNVLEMIEIQVESDPRLHEYYSIPENYAKLNNPKIQGE
jgi:hypothetical protein